MEIHNPFFSGVAPTFNGGFLVGGFATSSFSGPLTSSIEIGTAGNAALGSITIDAGMTVTEAGPRTYRCRAMIWSSTCRHTTMTVRPVRRS